MDTKVMEAPTYKLKQSRMQLGLEGIRMRIWFVVPEAGTPYGALFDPAYWEPVRHMLSIGDFLRIEPDEQHYTADLKVLSTGAGGVQTAEYFRKEWPKVEMPAALTSRYRVRHAGPHHRWRIERISDGHVEQSGFVSEAEAHKWLTANIKALEQRKEAAVGEQA